MVLHLGHRVNYQYSEASNNQTTVHGDYICADTQFATERKAESTVSDD